MSETSGQQLPKGWAAAQVRDLLLPTSTINPERRGPGYFTYIDIDAVDNKRQLIAGPKRLSNSDAPSRARNHLADGDVLFCLVRPYLKNIAVVPPELHGGVGSTAFCVCRPAKGVISRFLLNLLRRDSFIDAIPTYGSSPPAARDDEFLKQSVFLPPTEEQTRIADALEELLSDLDAGVASLERVRTKLKDYRSAVLKAAVEGSLTAEWRKQHLATEPASDLLARILGERRLRWEAARLQKFKEAGKTPPKDWKTKYKEPAAPDVSNLPVLPGGWCWVRLGELLFEIEAGKSFECLPRRAEPDEWGIIKVSAMSWGTFDETENKAVPAGREVDRRYEIRTGDILLSRANTFELVGASVLVNKCRQRLLLSDKSMRLIYSSKIDRLWLATILSSPWVRRQLSRESTGMKEGMRNVSQESVLDVLVPLAPVTECLALVECVEGQLSIIDHLEADLEAKLRSAQALRESILRHAFEGKLVPQDPNDEPAATLLKRIAAEREELARAAKASKQTRAKTKRPQRRAAKS